MNKTDFNMMQDRAVRRYCTFLLLFSLVLTIAAALFCSVLTNSAKTMLLSHDEAVASSLIGQGISEDVIAGALTAADTVRTQEGFRLLQKTGIRPDLDVRFLPQLHIFQRSAICSALVVVLPLCLLLLGASLLFLHKREHLYRNAVSVIDGYINGSCTLRLPQTGEGAIFRMFSAVDRLAALLRAQNETEQKTKIFLRNTISDISHQLKTPLAALFMYQEIMENEPDHPEVIQQFAAKTGLALRRMEQLTGSMLKITRLDAGNVVFEKKACNLSELVSQAVNDIACQL